MKIPLFPLDVVLFPRGALPLHIFEERYKDMVAGCFDRKAPFGVVNFPAEFARLRKMIQEDPDAGWREQYGADGTEEVLPAQGADGA